MAHSACRLCLANSEDGRVEPSVRRATDIGLLGAGELAGPFVTNDGGLNGVVVFGVKLETLLLFEMAACWRRGVDGTLECLGFCRMEGAGLAVPALVAAAADDDDADPIL